MLFDNEKTKEFNKTIKEKNLKAALLCVINGFDTNEKQTLKLLELNEDNQIFSVLDELAHEGYKLPDKYLVLSSLYFNATYRWEIIESKNRTTLSTKYNYLISVYEEKIKDSHYCRLLFTEWKRLFDDMIKEKTVYKNEHHIQNLYQWPHNYEEYVIERSAQTLCSVMFKEATKEEIYQLMSDCHKYKVPKGDTENDTLYNKQESRYYDVIYFSTWLSENALPQVMNINKIENPVYGNQTISLVSQGVINEIKLYFESISKDKNLLEPQDNMLFDKLYQQRLPELLTEYQGFDKKYSDMKNRNNQNADELLYNALLEMRSIFEDFNEKITVKKIENLSLSVRLTKEYIKHSF